MKYVRLSEIAEIINGYAFKSSKYVKTGIRIIRIANVQDGCISDEQPCFYPLEYNKNLAKYMLYKDDLLISLTGNVGRVGLLTDDMLPAALNQRVCCIRPKKNDINIKFLYYYFSRKQFIKDCVNASQGVAQLNLSTKWLAAYPIPVFSEKEQESTVNRIEELFSELDAGIETLKKTKAQLEVYRQAVLKEAFKLCEKKLSLETVCQSISDGDHMPPPKTKSGIPFIMISNVNNNLISWENTAFVGDDYYNSIDEKRRPQKGDVLYTVTGSYGIPILIDFDKQFCFQRHIALLRPNHLIQQKYLYYAMMEPDVYSQATKVATGTAQKTVGLGVLRKIKIPFVDSIDIQSNIVQKIENNMSVCNSIEQTVDTALQQAEELRQSILKKAFEDRI